MSQENWQQVREIFVDAMRQPPEKRGQFLERACSGDKQLRQEVESLLSSYESAESFLEKPARKFDYLIKIADVKLESGKCFAHYEIIRQIGAGGMGEVYLAKDKKLDRKVAVKILNEKFARHESNLRRFIREAKAASALNHPNILTIYEIGETDKIHYLVSEYIEGKTLREMLAKKNLKLPEMLDIAVQTASALSAAHAAKIVHRDIKPENVMIRPDGLVKILDFGLAKLVEQKNTPFIGSEDETSKQSETAEGIILGTVQYMSPEQTRGKQIDERSDIWSLGCVLYEMIAGRAAFNGDTIADLIADIVKSEPAPLTQFAENLPPRLEEIITKTLEKNAGKRYQRTKDLLTDLKALEKRLEFEAEFIYKETKKTEPLPAALYSQPNTSPNLSPVSSSQLPPNNLAENFSQIIGREREISEIKNLLRQNNTRLVTLTGIGGTGKTTLARTVAGELLPDFAGGVFFIELSAVKNSELVVSTVAYQLGVKEIGRTPIFEVLKDFLREREILLVIDNFEQIIEAAPQIAELIAASSKLKILITSREILNLSAEREFVVSPLDFPNKTAPATLDELSKYEAIKLFVERARNAKPNFSLTDENASAVAGICAWLDGLPLAIELAAARVKILSPQAILTKLENSLQILTGGAQDLPARQQTMRNAIEWSFELLSEAEKSLFRRLAVFAGGFTFEAAESVVSSSFFLDEKNNNEQGAANNEPPTIDVLNGITSLIDKSLLISNEKNNGERRFRMLGVVREYALKSLESSGEAQTARRSHAEHFLALGERAEPHLQTARAGEWLDRLEEEHDNLRSAIRWLFETDAESAARLAAAIRIYLINHSHLTEGREWLETALERNNRLSAGVRFKLLNVLGWMTLTLGDYEAARQAHEENLAESRATGDKVQIAESLRGLGAAAHSQGDYNAARKFHEESLIIHRESGDKFGIAKSLNGLATVLLDEGDIVTARPLLEESLMIFRQIGNESGICFCLLNLGEVAHFSGDYEAAQECYVEVLTIAQNLDYKDRISFCLDGFAAIAAERKEWEKAAQLAGAAEKLRETIGYAPEIQVLEFRRKYIEKSRNAFGKGAFSDAYERGRKMKTEEAIALALEKKNKPYQTSKEIATNTGDSKQEIWNTEKKEQTTEPEKTADKQSKNIETVKETNEPTKPYINKSFGFVLISLGLVVVLISFGYWFFLNRFPNKKQIGSIAVLPLKSLDTNDNYLGLGIADALIRRLSQTGKLIVRPTSAVRRYQSEEIDALTAAQQLKTDAVLEGSVQRSGDRLRVSVNLLRVSDGMSLWANSFEMQATDIFAIQDTVAQEVASNLRLQLDPSQQEQLNNHTTSNPIALEYYQKGVYTFDDRVSRGKEQMDAAIDFFKQAINADPDFALAHAQLAYVNAVKGVFFNPTETEWAQLAEEEINRAQALDPQIAETHLARFQLLYSAYGNYQGEAAFRELLLAQKLNPNVGHAEMAYLYLHLGLEDFAEREIRRASEIDPTSGYLRQLIFLQYQTGNKYDEYGAQRNLYSDEFMDVWYFMGKGQLDEAQKAFDKWSAKISNNFDQSSVKALLLALKGDFSQAEALIPLILSKHPVKDPLYHHSTFDIARVYALEGKSQEAVKWLRETADSGWSSYPMFESDAYLNPIRQTPEFIQFMTEMKARNDNYRREFASISN